MKSVRQLITIFRTEYICRGINVKDIADNPIDQFEKWIKKISLKIRNILQGFYLYK
jgi:hypothetical protein